MRKKSHLLLLVAGLVLSAQAFALPAAPDKPDFTGTWKLNVDKSEFGQIPPPVSETEVITHSGVDLKIATTSEREQGKQSYEISLKIDGTDTPLPPGTFPDDSPFKIVSAKAEWDGAALIVSQVINFQGTAGSVKSTYTLSADGKVLSKSSDISMQMGDFTIKTIYDKQ